MPKKKKLQTLLKELETIVNKYIRLRDYGKPCISCSEYKELEAGHFYPVHGYKGLRYDEDNIHGECARCNRFDESHLIGYTQNLPDRIGETDFKALQKRAEEYKRGELINRYYFKSKYDRTEIEEMIKEYKEKVKRIKRETPSPTARSFL